MNKGILVWGYFSSLLLLLGAIFTNQGFVVGKVLFLVSFLSFNLGYLVPLFFTIFKKNQENKIGSFVLFGGIGFFLFLTGISFFIVSWSGGIVLIYIGGAILILAILTMIAFYRRFYATSIYSWFPVLIFAVFIVVSLLTSTVNRSVMRIFTLNNYNKTTFLELLNHQNEYLYQQLINDSTLLENKVVSQEVKAVHEETKQLNRYIDQLKIDLIKQIEGKKYKVFEGKRLTNLFHIQSNVEINSGKQFMIKAENKASELKKQIDKYKKNLLKLTDKTDTALVDFINFSLPTKALPLSNRNYEKNWEYQNFYEFPLVVIIYQLTEIQTQINLCEKEFFIYLQFKYKLKTSIFLKNKE